MTATPIPRTLQLALTGVRELSIIATPPVDRLAVRTLLCRSDPVILREAVMREHFRGGQKLLFARVSRDLDKFAERLKTLALELRLVLPMGKMPVTQLEDTIGAFYESSDILLSNQYRRK